MASEHAAGIATVRTDASERNYWQASITLRVQPDGEPNHRIEPPLGGYAIGGGITVGRFVTAALAFEGEFLYGGSVSVDQAFHYTFREDYVAESREMLFNGLLRWKPRGTSPVEFVGGGGLAVVRSGRRDQTRTDEYPPRTSVLPDDLRSGYVPNLTGGVEVAARASSRTSVVSTFRIRFRPASYFEELAGVGSYTVFFGVGARMSF